MARTSILIPPYPENYRTSANLRIKHAFSLDKNGTNFVVDIRSFSGIYLQNGSIKNRSSNSRQVYRHLHTCTLDNTFRLAGRCNFATTKKC